MTSGPRIGPWQLAGPVVLAPMAGISDAPFRRLCRGQGASLAASEMTTADASLWSSRKSRHRLNISDDRLPRVVQIAGSDPLQLASAARYVVQLGANIVDINMGCPAKKVCRHAAGSALLRDPKLVEAILSAVIAAVDVPVTLKIRTGWNPENRNGVSIAQLAERAGISAIAVHGRTRACAYRGDAEYETVKKIKAAVSIPVFANGDINSPAKALDVLTQTGADGLMIGRAARGRPWLFAQVLHYLKENKLLAPPSRAERRDMMLDHLDTMYVFYGSGIGVRVARKHLAWYSEHMESGTAFRHRAVRTETTGEQMQLIQDYFAGRGFGEDAATVSALPRYRARGAEDDKEESRPAQENPESQQETDQRAQSPAA